MGSDDEFNGTVVGVIFVVLVIALLTWLTDKPEPQPPQLIGAVERQRCDMLALPYNAARTCIASADCDVRYEDFDTAMRLNDDMTRCKAVLGPDWMPGLIPWTVTTTVPAERP